MDLQKLEAERNHYVKVAIYWSIVSAIPLVILMIEQITRYGIQTWKGQHQPTWWQQALLIAPWLVPGYFYIKAKQLERLINSGNRLSEQRYLRMARSSIKRAFIQLFVFVIAGVILTIFWTWQWFLYIPTFLIFYGIVTFVFGVANASIWRWIAGKPSYIDFLLANTRNTFNRVIRRQ